MASPVAKSHVLSSETIQDSDEELSVIAEVLAVIVVFAGLNDDDRHIMETENPHEGLIVVRRGLLLCVCPVQLQFGCRCVEPLSPRHALPRRRGRARRQTSPTTDLGPQCSNDHDAAEPYPDSYCRRSTA